jgi:DNA-binding transcriptional regulator YiaG
MIKMKLEDFRDLDIEEWQKLRVEHDELDVVAEDELHSNADDKEIAWLLDKDDAKESWTDDYFFPSDEKLDQAFSQSDYVNTRQIRHKLKLSQAEFAKKFRINLRTLQDWEIGRSKPQEAVVTYLRLIKKDADTIYRLIHAA